MDAHYVGVAMCGCGHNCVGAMGMGTTVWAWLWCGPAVWMWLWVCPKWWVWNCCGYGCAMTMILVWSQLWVYSCHGHIMCVVFIVGVVITYQPFSHKSASYRRGGGGKKKPYPRGTLLSSPNIKLFSAYFAIHVSVHNWPACPL